MGTSQFRKEFYNKKYDSWGSPPDGVRLSEGPIWTYTQIPWKKQQRFCKVTDSEGLVSYLTFWEARNKLGVALETLRKKFKGKVFTTHIKDFRVDLIPKFLFIAKTGRTHDEIREYFHRF